MGKSCVILAIYLTSLVRVAAESPGNLSVSAMPLWQRAIEQVTKKGSYQAAKYTDLMTVFGGNNNLLGSIETIKELKQPVGEPPVWLTQSRKTVGDPGMVINVSFDIHSNPGSILDGYDSWTMLRRQSVDGVPVEVWKGVESRKANNAAVAYLNPVNNYPVLVELSVPYKSMLGDQVVEVVVRYRPISDGADAIWLPWRSEIEQSGRLFFIKKRIKIETEFCDWRLASPSPAK